MPARYARAIAYYRMPQLKEALALINGLIAQEPRDPYFEELKGQMLFENGHIKDAVAPYQQAVDLDPANALLKIELAQVELEDGDPALVPKAMTLLNAASTFENDNSELWRLLAVAYGRSGNMGMMALALAEQGMADGDFGMPARRRDVRSSCCRPAHSASAPRTSPTTHGASTPARNRRADAPCQSRTRRGR